VDILLDGQDERRMAEIKDENGRKERHYLFFDGESVTGKVNVTLHRKTNRLEHQGIRIEFIGQIELYYDRGNHHEFLSLVKQLAGPGELVNNVSFDFEFNQVEKPYECYTGANVRLRYFLRVTVVRRLTDMTREMDLLVHTLSVFPEMNNPIKMEVGIEECLHIEFEYNKSKYHLKDVIVGKIYFLLVRIKIKHMEVAIIKRETTGSGPNTFHDNETIAKYEIMDGAPVRGESIPIRVFLAGYDLTPTMRDVNKKFSVRYYLNLVLVDEEERRYFKQQEITLWRKCDRVRKSLPLGVQQGQQYMPQAMARHGAPDASTSGIRTAPTPGTEPSTPIATPATVTVEVPSTSTPDMMEEQPQLTQPALHSVPDVEDQPHEQQHQQPVPQQQQQEQALPAQLQAAPISPSESPKGAVPVVQAAKEVPESAPAAPPALGQVAETASKEEKNSRLEEAIDSRRENHVESVADQPEKPPEPAAEPPKAAVLTPPGENGDGPPPMDDLTLDDDEEEEEVAVGTTDGDLSDLENLSPPPTEEPGAAAAKGSKSSAEALTEAVTS